MIILQNVAFRTLTSWSLVSLQAETANVLWSFSTFEDPSSEKLSSANIHTSKGAVSLNLLGGLPSAAPDPIDLQYFDVTVDNVSCNIGSYINT